MRPVLIGASERPDGRLALVYSVTPGHRVTVVAPAGELTETLAEEIASRVIPLISGEATERTPA